MGAYLKTPRYPIWLVCSESHFSVLFGLQRELLTSQDQSLQFDLYYYDGLANQQEEIRLTVCKCVLSVTTFKIVFKTSATVLQCTITHGWINNGWITQITCYLSLSDAWNNTLRLQCADGIFVFLAVGKWSPSFKDVGADLVPPLDLCIRTRYSHF